MDGEDGYRGLGERLRTLRRKARLTQAKLAEYADISCVYVNKLERGIAVPSLQVLDRLARSLNTDAATLLAGAAGPEAAAVPEPSPYLALYLSRGMRGVRQLVFDTTDTPVPPLPSLPAKKRK